MASSAISASSAASKTLPVGLCGVLSRIRRVRGPIADRSSAGSNRYLPSASGRSRTGTARAPASAMHAW